MSWCYEETNPTDNEKDMFRLEELYDEEIDSVKYTEEELELIERINKTGCL